MKRSGLRGLSLVEMMIYMTLLVLIAGSALIVVVMANRFFNSTIDNNAVQREAQITMLRISHELEESKQGKVLVEPEGIIFLSPRTKKEEFNYDYGGDGLLVWQKWVCYYVDSQGGKQKLCRAEAYLKDPTTDPPDPTLTTADFKNLSTRPEIVAHDLLAFEVEDSALSANTFDIRASFGREGRTNNTDGDRMAEKVDIENSVHLRN